MATLADFSTLTTANPGLLLIVFGGIAIYIASRAAVDAVAGGATWAPATAGWMAIGHWIPVAILAAFAAATGRSAIAVGIVFSTAVGALSLAAGAAILIQPPVSPIEDRARSLWPLLVPTGVLAFLYGFAGHLTLLGTAVLTFQGIVVLLVWRAKSTVPADRTVSAEIRERSEYVRSTNARTPWTLWGQVGLAGGLAWVGSYMTSHGIDSITTANDRATPGLLTATLVAPLAVLPMIGTATTMAQRGRAETAVTGHVGFALLNACAAAADDPAADDRPMDRHSMADRGMELGRAPPRGPGLGRCPVPLAGRFVSNFGLAGRRGLLRRAVAAPSGRRRRVVDAYPGPRHVHAAAVRRLPGAGLPVSAIAAFENSRRTGVSPIITQKPSSSPGNRGEGLGEGFCENSVGWYPSSPSPLPSPPRTGRGGMHSKFRGSSIVHNSEVYRLCHRTQTRPRRPRPLCNSRHPTLAQEYAKT